MTPTKLGLMLREWRQRRRMSQLELAMDAGISQRHMSFVETGRSHPSRQLVLRFADSLSLTIQSRNALLLAAGFAPSNRGHAVGDFALAAASEMVQPILDAHMPFPALAVDRQWNLVASNAAAVALMAGVASTLLTPPVNVLRLSLHPDGLALVIINLAEWKRHLVEKVNHQVAASGDERLQALAEELRAYPAPASPAPASDFTGLAVPLIIDSPLGQLSFHSTATMFGTPAELTLADVAIECFLPANPETADRLRQMNA
nr:helix-turn-helix transcriptional regulator [uncultured Sphingomonas sp.]